jgi:hypothetical protein
MTKYIIYKIKQKHTKHTPIYTMIKNGTKRTWQNVISEKVEVSVLHAYSTRTQSNSTYSTSNSLHCTWHSEHNSLTKEHLCESHAVVSTVPQYTCTTVTYQCADVIWLHSGTEYWNTTRHALVAKEIIKQEEGMLRHQETLVLWLTGDSNSTCQTVKFITFQPPAIHRHLRNTNKTHTYIKWTNT